MLLIGLDQSPRHIMSDLYCFLDSTALCHKSRHLLGSRKVLPVFQLLNVYAECILDCHVRNDSAFVEKRVGKNDVAAVEANSGRARSGKADALRITFVDSRLNDRNVGYTVETMYNSCV